MIRFVALLLLCTHFVSLLHAAPPVPPLLHYQGRLADGSGPVSGAATVVFTFWNASVGGEKIMDFQDEDVVTPDADGIFSTFIGDEEENHLPSQIFERWPVWLNVNVNGEDLLPRKQMTTGPYAFTAQFAYDANNAGKLGNVAAADYASKSEVAGALAAVDSKYLPLRGGAHVIVQTTTSAQANAANLIAAVRSAKTLQPNGAPRSAANRMVLLVPPGRYDLGTTQVLLDTEFMDLVGISSVREDQYLYGVGAADGITSGLVRQTANDVCLQNLTIDCSYPSPGEHAGSPAGYFPDSALPLAKVKNCRFIGSGPNVLGMRVGIDYAGTYEDCAAGGWSFGYMGYASGTFRNCSAEGMSFGVYGSASGTFVNCSAHDFSFGYGAAASGSFIECDGRSSCFGAQFGQASGTFIDCRGGMYSFGGLYGLASGTFTNCTAGTGGFGGMMGYPSGRFVQCRMTGPGWNSTFSGQMEHCYWNADVPCASTARIYGSTIVGTVDLQTTNAGITQSRARVIQNDTANVFGATNAEAMNIEDSDVN